MPTMARQNGVKEAQHFLLSAIWREHLKALPPPPPTCSVGGTSISGLFSLQGSCGQVGRIVYFHRAFRY